MPLYSVISGFEWSERVHMNVRWETLFGPEGIPRCLAVAGMWERSLRTIHPTPDHLRNGNLCRRAIPARRPDTPVAVLRGTPVAPCYRKSLTNWSSRSKYEGNVLATQPGSRIVIPSARSPVIAKLIAIR